MEKLFEAGRSASVSGPYKLLRCARTPRSTAGLLFSNSVSNMDRSVALIEVHEGLVPGYFELPVACNVIMSEKRAERYARGKLDRFSGNTSAEPRR